MCLLKAIGDEIHPSIKLEVDYPSKYSDGHMPILDLKVWIERVEGRCYIRHEHYAKAVSSKAVVFAKSAFPWKDKRTVLTQDALRILLNCSRDIPWSIKAAHLSTFSAKMQFSGYSHGFRFHVVKSAINAYEQLREQERNNVRPLYRAREWNRKEREQQKAKKKRDWYKKGGYDSVIFLPSTPASSLTKKCQDVVEESRLKIRVVETAGTTLKAQLQRSNPFLSKQCGRDKCFKCETGGKGNCRKRGVIYVLTCVACEAAGKTAKYIGQASRSAYSRGKEHLAQMRSGSDGSRLHEHAVAHHGGETPTARMDVLDVYGNDCMLRQIAEAVHIRSSKHEHLLNKKTEWNTNFLPNINLSQSP